MLYANYVRNKIRHLYRTAEAEGVPCILKYSKGKYMKDYEIYGNSVQNGTPSPENPVEIQSVGDLNAKNLIPYPYSDSTKTLYGIIFTDNNGVITLDGTTTLAETGVADFRLMSNAKLEAGTYTLSGCPKTGATYTYRLFVMITHNDNTPTYANDIGNGSTFTVTNTDLVTITIRIGGQLGTVSNLVFKPQLEKGSSATEYGPYHKYDIPITVAGKNLIPYPYMYTTKTENGVTWTDNGDGSVTVSGTATGYSDFFFKVMSIAPNTTFTFSKNQSDDAANIAFTLKQLDENRALIGTEISLIPTVVTHTFTTAENARYIQIACKRYGNVECKGTYKPMLELGDTATEYEPYHEPITTHIYLDEPLRKVGNYSDYVDFKKQKIVRWIEVLDNTGTKSIDESLKVVSTPTEEPISLPTLQTFKGTTIMSVDTTVLPSNIKVTYVRT